MLPNDIQHILRGRVEGRLRLRVGFECSSRNDQLLLGDASWVTVGVEPQPFRFHLKVRVLAPLAIPES
jgi:hypothetical protein